MTDAKDFADYIKNYFAISEHTFSFADNEREEQQNKSIENKISESDIFSVIITDGSLKNLSVEKEVFQAQRENKTIIPCIYRNVKSQNIKWGLDRIKGIEFEDKYELARILDLKILQHSANRISKFVQSIDITSSYSPNWYLKRAYKFKEIGKYKESAEMFGELLKLQPENIDAWREKGFCLLKIGKYEDALKAYDEAIELKPNDVDSWFWKATTLQLMGNFNESIESYDKVIDLNPDHAQAWSGRSFSLTGLEKFEEAIECSDRSLGINSEDFYGWYSKAIALATTEHYKESIEYFDRALEIRPDHSKARKDRDEILERLKT